MKQATGESPAPAWTKILPLLGLAVIACVGLRTISNSDIWIHLASGRWIADHGIPRVEAFSFTRDGPWLDPCWLYDRAVYALWQAGGPAAVTLAHLAAVLAAFALLIPMARAWGGRVEVGLGLILSAWLLAPRLDARPSVVCLLFTALFLFVLDRARKPWVSWAVLLPAQVLWANLHPSFLLGPLLVSLFAIQAWVAGIKGAPQPPGAGGQPRKTPLALAALAVATLVLTLANPYGPRLHVQAILSLGNPASNYVQEWISPFSDQFTGTSARHLVTLALLIGAGGLIAQKRRLPLVLTALAVVSAFLVVRSLLAIDVFALLAFPFICLSLGALGEFAADRLSGLLKLNPAKWPGLMALATVVLAAGSCAAFATNGYYTRAGSASAFGLGAEYDLYPKAALEAVGDRLPERALNLVMDGGFLAWRAPGRKIFVDHRAAVYGSSFYEELANGLLRGEEKALSAVLDGWQPQAVIINACARNAGVALRNLMTGGRWALAYFDGTTAVLLQPVSANRSLLTDAEVQAAGLELLNQEFRDYRARQGGLIRPAVPPRLIGAGAIFMALGRYREAEAIYELLAAGAPAMGTAALSLGICQVQIGEKEQAVASLERACRLLPRNALSWLWLSRAYAQSDDEARAREAYDHGKRINAPTAEAFGDPLQSRK